MKIIHILLASSIWFMVLSCKKEEGKGGKLGIKGSVRARYYSNNLSKYTQQRPGADLDVYLIYGNNVGIGDKTKTDYEGEFEFKYLRSGNYKVYVYSKDTTGGSASEDITVVQNVDLTSDVTLSPFVIALEDKRKLDEGGFNISGKVFGYFYNENFTVKTGSGYLVDQDVYLIKEGSDPLMFKKETTMLNGSFVFTSLPAGDYTIYAISKDTNHTSATGESVSQIQVTLTSADANIGNLVIAKEDKRVGQYSIKGQVWAQYYDETFSVKTVKSVLADEDVYIARVGESGYLDKVSTDYKGDFMFPELMPGKYVVYAYSGDTTQTNGANHIVVKKELEVTNASIDMGVITLAKEDKRELVEGPFKISGVVRVIDCNSEFSNCSNSRPTAGFDVFIMKEGGKGYFDKTSSSDGGTYEFRELPNGNYIVYVISKNELSLTDPDQPKVIAIKKNVTVNDGNVTDINFELID